MAIASGQHFHVSGLLVAVFLCADLGLAVQQRHFSAASKATRPVAIENRTAAVDNHSKRVVRSYDNGSCVECEGEATTVHASVIKNSSAAAQIRDDHHQQCSCTLRGSDCKCESICDSQEEVQICGELLGRCKCKRSASATCECFGYCPKAKHFEDACASEAGCEWTGVWCEAQHGLMWE
eukprot:TRINITY_DN52484_c0_g1_i1.p1 TRINITY_DN52484_c0_g1~~TRINITY_DN52484_c0_g1_i1.p1  ORF type:complete len:180 (-),score=22.47 TRINITY_DN52484_c0_g1_i1:153-692(-)